MKLPDVSNGQAQIILGVAGLGVALAALYYTKKQVTDGLNAVNPTNDKNVINETVNGWFGFDNKTSSLGTWIYDKFNPEPKTTKTVAKPYESKITPKEATKAVAPFMASKDFRFYEMKPK